MISCAAAKLAVPAGGDGVRIDFTVNRKKDTFLLEANLKQTQFIVFPGVSDGYNPPPRKKTRKKWDDLKKKVCEDVCLGTISSNRSEHQVWCKVVSCE